MMQWVLLLSLVRGAKPTDVRTPILNTFFAVSGIAFTLDFFAALCAIHYTDSTLELVNHAHGLLEDKRDVSENISNGINTAKKRTGLPGSDNADLDILIASCKSIYQNLHRLHQ